MITGTVQGPGHWLLTAEGAAVHTLEKTAVVADMHLGYEWARGTSGDCVPAHSLDEALSKLDTLLLRINIKRLIVAGDLVESPRFCRGTARDLARLAEWLGARGIAFLCLAGNHDAPRRPALLATFEVDGWTVAHGHRPVAGSKTITGHLHPVLRASAIRAPCFLVGPTTIILPAFSANAAGVGLAALPKEIGAGRLHCVASAGEELLDFGPASGLVRIKENTSR